MIARAAARCFKPMTMTTSSFEVEAVVMYGHPQAVLVPPISFLIPMISQLLIINDAYESNYDSKRRVIKIAIADSLQAWELIEENGTKPSIENSLSAIY